MPQPDMVFVLSAAVEAIGYDEERRELHVRFRETGTHVYSRFRGTSSVEFLEADSKGAFFNDVVRPGYPDRDRP